MYFLLYLYLILHVTACALSYFIPDPKVEILSPRGFRISIPHEKDIKLVGFHINIDKDIALNKVGDFSGEFTQPTNGLWAYENTSVFIQPGTKINYWIHVQNQIYSYRKLGSETLTEQPNCELSPTTVHQKPVCKGALIFEDNFDNLNLSKWKHEIRIPIDLDDGAFVSFQDRPENCFINDGQLHIVPNLLSEVPGYNESSILTSNLDLGTKCTAIIDVTRECARQTGPSEILPPVISARIRTKEFFSFRYGKVEVRAKLPKGDWLFPQILLEPVENYYGYAHYTSGQMRVAFIRGNVFLTNDSGEDISGKRIYGGVVLSANQQLRDLWLKSSAQAWHMANDFHTYTLTWTESYISLEVDGREYGRIRGNFGQFHKAHGLYYPAHWDNGHSMAPFDREFYLTLGVSVGGNSDFPDGCTSGEKSWVNGMPTAELKFWNDRRKWQSSWRDENVGLHVDYVKVYAL